MRNFPVTVYADRPFAPPTARRAAIGIIDRVGSIAKSSILSTIAHATGVESVVPGDLVSIRADRITSSNPGPLDALPVALPDGSLALPGSVVIGQRSWTFMAGGVAALPLRLTAAQFSAASARNPITLHVPPVTRVAVELKKDSPSLESSGTDLALALCAAIGSDSLLGRGVEIAGPALAGLSVDSRAVAAGVVGMMGAATVLIEADLRLIQDLRRYSDEPFQTFTGEAGNGIRSHTLAASASENWLLDTDFHPRLAAELRDTMIDRVVVAGPAGANFEHLQVMARLLRGRAKRQGVEMVVQPESPSVEERARRLGILSDLERFGAKLIPSAVAAPLALSHDRVLVVGATAWLAVRKIEQVEAWMSGPQIAAAAALTGEISELGQAFAGASGDSKVSARHVRGAGGSVRTPQQKDRKP